MFISISSAISIAPAPKCKPQMSKPSKIRLQRDKENYTNNRRVRFLHPETDHDETSGQKRKFTYPTDEPDNRPPKFARLQRWTKQDLEYLGITFSPKRLVLHSIIDTVVESHWTAEVDTCNNLSSLQKITCAYRVQNHATITGTSYSRQTLGP